MGHVWSGITWFYNRDNKKWILKKKKKSKQTEVKERRRRRKKKRNPEQTEVKERRRRKKRKKTQNNQPGEEREKKKSKVVKSCDWVLFVGPLYVFNYNIPIELSYGNWKQPKCVFSFHNS